MRVKARQRPCDQEELQRMLGSDSLSAARALSNSCSVLSKFRHAARFRCSVPCKPVQSLVDRTVDACCSMLRAQAEGELPKGSTVSALLIADLR